MTNKLPFEIISERSDLDWMAANPQAARIEYKDFLSDQDKREKVESIVKTGRLVLVTNGQELVGAVVPKNKLMIHGLFVGENTEGFFNSINNRVMKQDFDGEDGVDLSGKLDSEHQTTMVVDNRMNMAYGFVSAEFVKDNLVSDDQSNCLFLPHLRKAVKAGMGNWEERFEQAFIRLEKARDNIYEESTNFKNPLTFFFADHLIDNICRQLNAVDSLVSGDKEYIMAMFAPDNAGRIPSTPESRIGEP